MKKIARQGIAMNDCIVQYSCPIRGGTMTIETTYSQAREQLKSLMDRAVDDREVILVRRRTGGDVAMIAADELESLVETAHLLRSKKNAQRLLAALSRARGKSIKPTPLADLKKLVGIDEGVDV
jgi:antitoxin YefM